MAYSWQSDIIRPDGENGTEVLDGQGVFQPQIEGGDNITIENGRINASGTLENVQADYTETDTSAPSYIKHKPDLSIYATASGMETELAGKQDVIDDLSTIRSGAEAGSTAVQPGDLAEVATTGSYTSLSNTPQNIVQDASYVHTDNNFSNADKSKLDGIAAGAEVNVQADWNEADSSSDAYIANKPTIPAAQVNSDWNASSGVSAILNKPDLSAYATDSELTDGLATKQDVISDLDTIRAGAALGATAAQPSDLPSSDELLPSASSGDAGKILSVDASGNPEWITPSGGTTYSAGDGIDIDANNVISADVDGTTIGIDSTTKKIKSLQTIPTVDQTYNASSTNAQSGVAVASAISGVNAVPASTSADSGKVLKVDSQGAPVWGEDSGGTVFEPDKGLQLVNGKLSVKTGTYSGITNNMDGDGIVAIVRANNTLSIDNSGVYVTNPLPASEQADAGKILTVNSSGNAEWATQSTVTVDQTYNASSSNAQSGTAVAGAIAGVNQVPASTASDENKVLTVNSSGNPVWENSAVPASKKLVAGSNITITENTNDVTISATDTTYTAGDGIDITSGVVSADVDGTTIGIDASTKKIKLLSTIPTVDQHYSASSTNAQSGTAVAEALGSSSTLAAGNGVTLTESSGTLTVAADVDNVTIGFDSTTHKIKSLQTIPSVDQTYNSASSNAQSGTAVAQAIAAIPAAPVEVVTNQNSFELEGDNPVKVEFTRVEDTSVIIHTTVDLTPGSPVDDDNQTMVIAFDLDAVNKAVDEGPVLKINTALPANSGLSQFQWGFNDSVSTSDNYSNYIQAGSNTSYGFPSGEIDLGNPGTIGTRSYARTRGIESNTKRYFIVKAVFASTYKSAISTWMSNGNITIKDWPTDGYGNKVVIPNIPASTSADANKVLTVDSNGDAIWQNVPTPSVDEVPDVTSSDNGKVLTAAYSGGTGSYSWQPASGGGGSYTAGDAIDITNNEISVDYDTDTLDMVYPELTVNMAQSVSSGTLSIPSEIQALAAGSSPTTVKIHIPANTLYLIGSWTSHPLRIAFCASNYIKNDEEGDFAQFTSIAVSCTYEGSDNYTWIDEQDIEITLPCNSLNGWSSSVTPVKFTISVDENDGNAYFGSLSIERGTTLSNPVVFSYPNTSAAQQLAVKNPLPASAQADSGKVLKVNASGNAEWGTDGFTTTAGVTDIQVVNALPASPVATVLYLIPEA